MNIGIDIFRGEVTTLREDHFGAELEDEGGAMRYAQFDYSTVPKKDLDKLEEGSTFAWRYGDKLIYNLEKAPRIHISKRDVQDVLTQIEKDKN